MAINITDVNEAIPNRAPVFSDGSSATRSVAENTASGANIGSPISATDADGNTLTYSLGGTNVSAFSIVSSSGQLRTKASLDYETKTSYSVTVSVSDGNGGSDRITVTINVTDVNETPVTPTISASTTSSLTESTLHGGVITLNLSDGTFERSPFTIRDAITLSGITGVTVDTFGVDRVSDTEVTVELAFDGNMTGNSNLTISLGADAIKDYDGAALTSQMSVTAVTESIAATTDASLTEATLDESVVTLTLSGRKYEPYNSVIRPAVSVSGIAGVTVRDIDIDRESDTEVSVELTFDGDITTDGTLTITVGADAIAGYNGPALTAQVSVSAGTGTGTTNTAPVFTDGTSTTRTIAENTAAGINIGTAITATDVNNDTLTYTLGGTDANVFSIESTTGQLKTRAALDYETKRTFTVTITVSDRNGGSDSITVTINVTDIDETPRNRAPVFTDGVSTTRSVAENTAAGQNIGRTISATDPDGDTLRYNFSGTEAASFSIDRTTGQLRTRAALDYETKRTYTVTITVSDGSLTDTITVTINVTDVDDTPTLNVSTAVPLTEATLHDSVVTLTVSKGIYHSNWNFVNRNVEVSGITGVRIRSQSLDRVSDTKATVELEFNGDFDTDGTLTFTVGAAALANYNGPALTAQISVSGSTESLNATTTAPLTEATLHGSVVTLTLRSATYDTNWNYVNRNVEVSSITGVRIRSQSLDRVSDTKATVELEFNGDFDTDGTLTFTVGAAALANYNGPALTAQISVSSITESATSLNATTAAPLTEATLHESVITLTLSGVTFDHSIFTIRDAITPTGISGVTVDTFDVDRVSDTEATVELTFDGNMTSDSTLTISLGADAINDYDGDALTSQISVTAVMESITASTASPLTEATLDESVVTLTLSGRKFEAYNSVIRPAVSVSGISGVTVGTYDIDRESDTEVSVELTFDGDITTDGTLTFTVGADAIVGYNGPALTVQVSVSAGTVAPVDPVTPVQPSTPTLRISTANPLTEATLHGGIITFNLSGGTFERSSFSIRDAITLTGISGVTVDTFGVDRVSDTEVTVELAFDGNMTANGTLTISIGAGAIKDYDGVTLTAQITVTANTESVVASTAAPLTEITLDESVVTLTLSGAKYASSIFDIRDAVTVSGIDGVTKPWHQPERNSDTALTVELEFDGTDFDTTSTLTFTVEADAIAGYNGPALTAQISVSANTESVVASTASPLTEATLDESVVTLTLSGRTFERSSFKIRDAVIVSGIAGVTVGTFDHR